MTRKEARELAMQILFQMEAQEDFSAPDIDKYLQQKELGNQKAYLNSLLKEVSSHIEEIDEAINKNSRGWPTSRMAKTDLAVARLAVGEILFLEEIPRPVSINEAVNLAKEYGTETSAGFINAVLSRIGA